MSFTKMLKQHHPALFDTFVKDLPRDLADYVLESLGSKTSSSKEAVVSNGKEKEKEKEKGERKTKTKRKRKRSWVFNFSFVVFH